MVCFQAYTLTTSESFVFMLYTQLNASNPAILIRKETAKKYSMYNKR